MKQPLRILYVEPSALVTGGAIALLRLVSALDRRMYRPLVVLGSDGPLVADFRRIPGCRVLCRPLPAGLAGVTRFNILTGSLASAPAAVRYAAMLRRIVRRWKPDVIHSNGLKTHWLSVFARRRGALLMWHIRDFISPPYMPERNAVLIRALARCVPDVLVCNSESTRASIDWTPSPGGGIYVVPDGVDRNLYPPPRPESPGSRARRIVMLGRLADWKGQHVLVGAARRLCRTDPTAQFVIAGGAINSADAVYERWVRESVEVYGLADRVTFLGVVRDVPALLAAADVVAHCSTSPEPFGQVVIEAMAAGVPIVASRLGAPASIITDGINGRLVAAGDDRALAATLAELLADEGLRTRLATAGLATVREQYGIERTVQRLVDVYRQAPVTVVPAVFWS